MVISRPHKGAQVRNTLAIKDKTAYRLVYGTCLMEARSGTKPRKPASHVMTKNPHA
jgi:hypothetical protein